jgi:hypothetical protein
MSENNDSSFKESLKKEIIENIHLISHEELYLLLEMLKNNEPLDARSLFGVLLGVPDKEVESTIEEIKNFAEE